MIYRLLTTQFTIELPLIYYWPTTNLPLADHNIDTNLSIKRWRPTWNLAWMIRAQNFLKAAGGTPTNWIYSLAWFAIPLLIQQVACRPGSHGCQHTSIQNVWALALNESVPTVDACFKSHSVWVTCGIALILALLYPWVTTSLPLIYHYLTNTLALLHQYWIDNRLQTLPEWQLSYNGCYILQTYGQRPQQECWPIEF